MPDRDLDVVVLGATSVTGRRTAAYLAERAGEVGARWAAAGRDAAKVERVLAEEGAEAPETIVADVSDPDSLATLAARSRVVLNLVGPYTLHGRPVIEACVEGGAHYVDLTGEMPFVRRVIAGFELRARDADVKVVQVCGFESLPPDLAIQLAHERAAEVGEALVEADVEIAIESAPMPPHPSDYVSGGTMQSLAAAASDPDAAAVTDPACLVDDPDLAARIRATSPIRVAPRRGRDGDPLAPMTPAAFINPQVIQRSFALRAAEANGSPRPFRYREGAVLRVPGAPRAVGYVAAGALSATQAAIGRLSGASPRVRERIGRALARTLPSSGFGPAADRLEPWRWRLRLFARTDGGGEIRVEALGEGHPGYLTTARILGEAGLLLAEDGATPARAGCLTPALALGTAGIDRFGRAGLSFQVL